jgi:hypothetical protein
VKHTYTYTYTYTYIYIYSRDETDETVAGYSLLNKKSSEELYIRKLNDIIFKQHGNQCMLLGKYLEHHVKTRHQTVLRMSSQSNYLLQDQEREDVVIDWSWNSFKSNF